MLSRHLNAIEAEVVQAGLTGFAVPDVPLEIAGQMTELAEQRHAHQQAAAEAAALLTVVEQQRQMLTLVGKPATKGASASASPARRPARPAMHAGHVAQKPASTRRPR
ncbi:hypothetical protein LMG28614_00206 [Paraburkholderia ultramafica]|uniref:Uncharacterized protein n=2 Tax=Paraburkholderia ultramafica TaxID=1544867 RepID=A0A6S7ASH0_9BURK|nr:hypothetical protein LMG28614_00206 [Paraburkholderia ultramafica]